MFTACCESLRGATLREQEVSADALSCTLTFSIRDREVWDAEFPALLRLFVSVGATARAEHVYEWRAERFGSFWRVVVEAPNDDIMLAASYTTLAPPKRFIPPATTKSTAGRKLVPAPAPAVVSTSAGQRAVVIRKTEERTNTLDGPRQVTTVRLVGRPEDRNYQATEDPVNPTSFRGPKAYAKLASAKGGVR